MPLLSTLRLSTACLSQSTVRRGLSGSAARYVRAAVKPSMGAGVGAKTKSAGQSIWGKLMAPATDAPFAYGKIFLASGSAVGLASLCYYGLGLSSQTGALEKSALWPQYVRDRIHSTYKYLGGGLVFTAGTAAAVARSPTLMRLAASNGILGLVVTFGAMIGTGIVARSISYDNTMPKHLAWALHCAVMGTVIAPLVILGGPILMRAALYTAAVVGGMSAIAACAPSDQFLYMGGALAMGFGVVLASSIGSMFLPPTTALGAGLYSVAMYGGLVLFAAFLLYDTQRVIRYAEVYPAYAERPYDPINAQMGIYADTLNIFIRIAMLLAGGGNRRK